MISAQTPFHCFEVHARPQTARAAHVHGIHEFFVALDGNGVQYAGTRGIPQRRGDVFVFPAGMPHYASGRAPAGAGGRVVMVPQSLFAPESFGDAEAHRILQHVVDVVGQGRNPLPLRAVTRTRLLALSEAMVAEFEGRKPGYQAACKMLLQECLVRVLRDPDMPPLPAREVSATFHEDRIGGVMRWVDGHFMEDIRVEAVARRAGMSRSHFHAVFRRIAGCTLVDYVTGVRIRAARRLLAESDRPILEISMDCGFESLSRFYDAFKRLTGRTPRQVRETGDTASDGSVGSDGSVR